MTSSETTRPVRAIRQVDHVANIRTRMSEPSSVMQRFLKKPDQAGTSLTATRHQNAPADKVHALDIRCSIWRVPALTSTSDSAPISTATPTSTSISASAPTSTSTLPKLGRPQTARGDLIDPTVTDDEDLAPPRRIRPEGGSLSDVFCDSATSRIRTRTPSARNRAVSAIRAGLRRRPVARLWGPRRRICRASSRRDLAREHAPRRARQDRAVRIEVRSLGQPDSTKKNH
jgi:hypothetical protein